MADGEPTERTPALTRSDADNSDEVRVSFKRGINCNLVLAIIAAAVGSAFQHGYNTGVVNAPQEVITNWIRDCGPEVPDSNGTTTEEAPDATKAKCDMSMEEATLIWAWIVAVFCIGGMIGGALVGVLADRVGRKGAMLANNLLVVISAALMLSSKYLSSYEMIIFGRFLIGVNSGINAGITPIYLVEIAPREIRGAIGTIYQLIITISILLSQILGMRSVLGNDDGWPFLLGLIFVPAIFQLATLVLCPESPKHLMFKGNDFGAETAMKWLRKSTDVESDLEEIRVERRAAQALPAVTLTEMVKNCALRQPLIISVAVMLVQQLTGINAVIFYSTSIFKSANLDESAAQMATLAMGIVNVVMTIVSLGLIEIAGRKTLMLAGISIMFIATSALFASLLLVDSASWFAFLAVAMVILFVIGFATGPGSIPWFFVTELFAQSARPMATSIAVSTNWVSNFLVGLGFAPLQLAIGPYVFVIFIALQALAVLYVKLRVPETKNKSIDEITTLFKK